MVVVTWRSKNSPPRGTQGTRRISLVQKNLRVLSVLCGGEFCEEWRHPSKP
jgi:hypothetical protein